MTLNFTVRHVGDIMVFDHSSGGCAPATEIERECIERIAELEATIRAMHAAIPAGSFCDPQHVADDLREIAQRASIDIPD